MASKGGMVAVGAVGLSLLALLAFSREAKAAPKKAPIENPYSPEACAAYTKERNARVASRTQMQAQVKEIESAMAAAADAGDEEQLKHLAQVRQGWLNDIGKQSSEVNKLNALIAKCPA